MAMDLFDVGICSAAVPSSSVKTEDKTVARLLAALDASRQRGAILESTLLDCTNDNNCKKADGRLTELKSQVSMYKKLYERARYQARQSIWRYHGNEKKSQRTCLGQELLISSCSNFD